MSKFILRLDDAAERMDVEKWNQMETLLNKYQIKPLVGVIPDCQDDAMKQYPIDSEFWSKILRWKSKGWTIALHGYQHVYCTTEGGINPVNPRSEFAGVSLIEQREKVRKGVEIFNSHGIETKVFFAPSHTFDENTIEALKLESDIRVISDTVANRPYSKYGMTFIPQQSGRVRRLPFHTVTFCYHPNNMCENDFKILESFIQGNREKFVPMPIEEVRRKYSLLDSVLRFMYYARR